LIGQNSCRDKHLLEKSYTVLQSSNRNKTLNHYAGNSPLVMVVEDEITSWIILQRVLESAGYETLRAATLEKAAEVLSSHQVSLMLLDINLPDGNGIDWYRNVQQNPNLHNVPVLFVTAEDASEQKVRGFSAGAVDYITKPFDHIEVLARVRTHLRLRAAYEQLAEMQSARMSKLTRTQKMLMPDPGTLPEAGFDVRVAQINGAGGDFYDVMQSGSEVWDFIIADASGHDVDTSLWTATLKALFHEYASIVNTPEEILRQINKSLLKILPPHQFFTVVLVRVNRKRGTVSMANAGHPPVIRVDANGQARILEAESDVLGMFPDAIFTTTELSSQSGSRLVLYTDGLVEGSLNIHAAIDGLAELSEQTRSLEACEAIDIIRIRQLESGSIARDDTILMLIEV